MSRISRQDRGDMSDDIVRTYTGSLGGIGGIDGIVSFNTWDGGSDSFVHGDET